MCKLKKKLHVNEGLEEGRKIKIPMNFGFLIMIYYYYL